MNKRITILIRAPNGGPPWNSVLYALVCESLATHLGSKIDEKIRAKSATSPKLFLLVGRKVDESLDYQGNYSL